MSDGASVVGIAGGGPPAPGEIKRVAVIKGGGSLERSVSLRSGARAQSALKRLGHDVDRDRRRPAARRSSCSPSDAGRGVHRPARPPRRGRHDAGTARSARRPLHRLRPSRVRALHRQGPRQAPHAGRRHTHAGLPLPAGSLDQEFGAGAARPAIEAALGFPLVVKPARGGSALGVKFAHSSAELPAAIVGALSYDDKALIERYVKGRDLAVSVLDAQDGRGSVPEPLALPVLEAIPREEDFYNYESRYEIGMTTFVCPAELPAETTARAQALALEVYELLGCHGVARVDLMLDESSGELYVLETNVVPGLTETSLLPQAADAAGIGFDALVARILQSAFTR